MAFEGLTEKLSNAFKKLRGKGRLSEADVKEAMREIRLALLEADVSYKVVKDFIKKTTERCVGTDVLESLDARADDRQDRQRRADRAHGQREPEDHDRFPAADRRDAGRPAGRGQDHQRRKAGGLIEKAGQKSAARGLRHLPSRRHQAAAGRRRTARHSRFRNGPDKPGRYRQGSRRSRRASTATTWSSSTPQAVCTSTRRSWTSSRPSRPRCNPDEILLVVDAMTGQDAVNAAKTFDEYLDIDRRHALQARRRRQRRRGACPSRPSPASPSNLSAPAKSSTRSSPSTPAAWPRRILGMGDVLTLIEKAEAAFDAKKAAELEQKLESNKFTLSDFYDQLVAAEKHGHRSHEIAGHDARHERRSAQGRAGRRKGHGPHRGHHPVHDPV